MSGTSSWPGLLGRRDEYEALSSLVAAAEMGHSRVLVLRGEARRWRPSRLHIPTTRSD